LKAYYLPNVYINKSKVVRTSLLIPLEYIQTVHQDPSYLCCGVIVQKTQTNTLVMDVFWRCRWGQIHEL